MLHDTLQFRLIIGGFALATILTPAVAPSQESDDSIDELIVVESRMHNEEYLVGDQLSVDAETLANIRPADTEQLLRRLPGLSVSRPGGPGGVSEIFLRGAESNFTAVYVDGIRLNNSANTRGGSFDYSTLAIQNVSRLDIATGAMSAIYGSDAMAGVIRIRSAWAEAGDGNVLLEAGQHSDWRASVAGGFALGSAAKLSLHASMLDGGDEIDGSRLNLNYAGAQLAMDGPGDSSWDATFRYTDRERASFPEVSGGPKMAVLRDLERAESSDLAISLEGSWTADRWESELLASLARLREDAIVPAVAPGALEGQPGFKTLTEYQRAELLWVGRRALASGASLALGFNYVDETGSDDGIVDFGAFELPNIYRLDRGISSAFVEAGKDWDKNLGAALALRLDHDGENTRLSGKFGLTQQYQKIGGRLWARVANGFKLPSFFALGNPLFGNPRLVSEEVRNIELGYQQDLSEWSRIELSVFNSRYEELVDFDFETFTNVNKGRIDIDGAQIRAYLTLAPRLILEADATWLDISSDSGPLRRRAKRTGGLSLIWDAGRQCTVDAALRYVGPRVITSIPTGDIEGGAYTLLDATVSFNLGDRSSVWIAVDNAFDADYQDAPGFPSPGRNVRLGIRISL